MLKYFIVLSFLFTSWPMDLAWSQSDYVKSSAKKRKKYRKKALRKKVKKRRRSRARRRRARRYYNYQKVRPAWGMQASVSRYSQSERDLQTSEDDSYLISEFVGIGSNLNIYKEYSLDKLWITSVGISWREIKMEGDAVLSTSPFSSPSKFELSEQVLSFTGALSRYVNRKWWVGAEAEFGKAMAVELKVISGPSIDDSNLQKRAFVNLLLTTGYNYKLNRRTRITPLAKWGAATTTDPMTYILDVGVGVSWLL